MTRQQNGNPLKIGDRVEFAPKEHAAQTPAPSRRDGRNSPPHVARIVFDAMLLQNCKELRLEIALPMMFLLSSNVCERGTHLSPPNGERPVTFLPFESLCTARLVHPVRGRALDYLHCIGNRRGRRQRKQDMDVVVHPTDGQGFHIVFAGNAAHVGPQPRLDIRHNGFAAVFGGEDTMEQGATIGV